MNLITNGAYQRGPCFDVERLCQRAQQGIKPRGRGPFAKLKRQPFPIGAVVMFEQQTETHDSFRKMSHRYLDGNRITSVRQAIQEIVLSVVPDMKEFLLHACQPDV